MMRYVPPRTRARGQAGKHRRSGATAVEFAFTAPILLFIIIFPCLEFGRAVMVGNQATDAARNGARSGIIARNSAGALTSTADITTAVDNYLANMKLPKTTDNKGSKVTVKVNGTEADANTAITGDYLEVDVSLDFIEVSWIPRNINWTTWLTKQNTKIIGKQVMRRE